MLVLKAFACNLVLLFARKMLHFSETLILNGLVDTRCLQIQIAFCSVPLLPLFEPPHVKTSNMAVLPAMTQISLGIRPVWSESSLCAQWEAKDPSLFFMGLIWDLAGRTAILSVLSCRGSFDLFYLALNQHCFRKRTLVPYGLAARHRSSVTKWWT